MVSSTTAIILTVGTLIQSMYFLFQFSKLVFNEILGNEQILDAFHEAEMALKKEPGQSHGCSVILL